MKLDLYKSFALLMVLAITPEFLSSQPLRITPYKNITITEPTQQDRPKFAAISVSSQKDIYLTDMALNRILRIDSTGRLIREVGGFGWDNEQLDCPLDIWAEIVN